MKLPLQLNRLTAVRTRLRYVCVSVMIIIAALLALVTSCNNNSPTIWQTCNADTTNISVINGIYYYHNKPFTGKLFALYKTGDTIFCNEYLNGKENGPCRKWYPNHRLAEERFFVNGKKEGHHTAYFANGNKKFDYHLHSDLFEGTQQEWFSNGLLFCKRNYTAGYETGMQQAWDSTGKLVINYEVVNGRNYGNIGKKNCRSLWSNDSFAVTH